MRYIWITLAVAVLHRILSFGFFLVGFAVGMTAFSSGPYAELGVPLMAVSTLLDAPLSISVYIWCRMQNVQSSAMEHWELLGLEAPLGWKLAWSFAVGVISAIAHYRYRLKKHGSQPYWKTW